MFINASTFKKVPQIFVNVSLLLSLLLSEPFWAHKYCHTQLISFYLAYNTMNRKMSAPEMKWSIPLNPPTLLPSLRPSRCLSEAAENMLTYVACWYRNQNNCCHCGREKDLMGQCTVESVVWIQNQSAFLKNVTAAYDQVQMEERREVITGILWKICFFRSSRSKTSMLRHSYAWVDSIHEWNGLRNNSNPHVPRARQLSHIQVSRRH